MGLVPIVRQEQQDEFERALYEYYETSTDPVYPNETAISDFGKGIWDEALDTATGEQVRVPATINQTGDAHHSFLAPVMLYSRVGDVPLLMYNQYNDPNRGRMLDEILLCAERRALISSKEGRENYFCGALTDPVMLTVTRHDGPAAIMYQPVYVGENRTEVRLYSYEKCTRQGRYFGLSYSPIYIVVFLFWLVGCGVYRVFHPLDHDSSKRLCP